VLYSPSQGLAYVKTPKGASLAIQDLFQRQFPDYRWAEAHEELPNSTLIFTFVREPLKRAMSAYAEIDVAYALRASPEVHNAMRTAFDKVSRKPGVRETPRVLAFLDDLVDHRFGGDDREHWMPTHAYSQVNFLCNHRIDFIGHLENQEDDWAAIQELARVPPAQRTPFPHAHDSSVLKTNATNASTSVCNRACQLKAADQHAPMTPALLQRICDVFASDFLCLGYPLPKACERLPLSDTDDSRLEPPPLNGTAALVTTSTGSAHVRRPAAPIYLMAQLDEDTAWGLARGSSLHRNTLFVVPAPAENRSTLFRLKRAENHSFSPSTSYPMLLREYDRYGWYWRSAQRDDNAGHSGGGDGPSISVDQLVAPLAVALPLRPASGHGVADATAETKAGVTRALLEAQQMLLLHRYDRVVFVGEGVLGTSAPLVRHAVDAVTCWLVDPLSACAAPSLRHIGTTGTSAYRAGNGSTTPHKHFLAG